MGDALRVLLVEDSEEDAAMVVRHLETGGYDLIVERVDTAKEMRGALSERGWDIVIADYAMPQFSGPDALGVLREEDKDLPFIIVSGAVGEEIAMPLLQGEAHDYVAKDDLTRLVPTVQRELRDAEERRRRRQAQEALLRREAFFRSLLEHTSDLILVLNGEGIIRYVSPSAGRMLGPDRQPRVGMPITKLVHEDDLPKVAEALARAIEGTDSLQALDLRCPLGDGTHRILDVVGSTFQDESGAISIVVNARDVTDRRQAEEDLSQANAALASASEQERSRIAAGLHDDLGQTLAIAGMRLSEVRRMVPDGEAVSCLDEIGKLIRKGMRDTKSLIFDLSPPALYECGIEAAVERLGEWIHDQYGVVTRVEDDGRRKPLDISVSVVLFRSVRELLVNIGKHAQTQSATVSTRKDGDAIRIGVEDEGVGFDPSRILAQTQEEPGFGIPSIRERLASVGGSFEINSTPGHGTRAALVAPLQNGDSMAKESIQ